jgi:hypothetical protein
MTAIMKYGAATLGTLALFAIVALPSAHAASYTWSPWTAYGTQTVAYGYPYTTLSAQQPYIQYLLQVLQQLEAQLRAYQSGHYDNDYDDEDNGDSEIDITTRSASDIDRDEARLNGEVELNDSDDAYVWFEYGDDEDDLDEDTPHIRVRDDSDFSVRLTDFDEDEDYYFRAVGEDEDGMRDYGSIKHFSADEDYDDDEDDNDGDEPDVTTDSARDISDDSAEIRGDVDMNDFENGIVFFVYGKDEDQIDDVEGDYDTYSEVDEDGDDLQKEKVDSDLDDDDSYALDISALDSDEDYYYALCVQYEDDDGDDVLACGSTKRFQTDD